MGRRLAKQLEDDDYLEEPDYDRMSDEELDELYTFGKLHSAPKLRTPKPIKRKAKPRFVDDSDSWLMDAMNDDSNDHMDDDMDDTFEDDLYEKA